MKKMLDQRHPPGRLCAIDDRYAIDNGAMIAWTGLLQVTIFISWKFLVYLELHSLLPGIIHVSFGLSSCPGPFCPPHSLAFYHSPLFVLLFSLIIPSINPWVKKPLWIHERPMLRNALERMPSLLVGVQIDPRAEHSSESF